MNLFFRLLLLMLRLRRRRDLDIWSTAITPFRVNPLDLDVLGHMNNSRYLAILDLGRMDLMIRAGAWDEFSARGWTPVVAGQSISYRRSLRLGQRFELHTHVLGIDDRWVYLEQTFRRRGQLIATAIVRGRFLRREGGTVETHELIAVMGEPPADREVPDWVRDWTAHSTEDLARKKNV